MKQPVLTCVSLVIALGPCACGSSPAASTAEPELAIVSSSGAPFNAVAGDALALKVVERMPDGSTEPLPSGARVTWTAPATISSLPPNSTTTSPVPAPLTPPTVGWVDNAYRADRPADLGGVLFVFDPGTLQNATVEVSANVAGVSIGSSVTAQVSVDPAPAGDWTRGESLYGAPGANCAECHGASGHGSPGAPEASTYSMAGATYDFPAPGINAEPGNAASDPAWNAALFAVASRADLDNGGITLRYPMPDWLTSPNPATGQPLSTQDLADIYAFLKTQTH